MSRQFKKIKKCENCSKKYLITASHQRFCSIECHKLYRREYDRKYKEKHKEKIGKKRTKWYFERKLKVTEILGGKCKHCGFDNHKALQIDHIKGGGHQERIQKGDYYWRLQKYIINNPEKAKKKYQLLCANCNWIKRWDNQEHIKASQRLRLRI